MKKKYIVFIFLLAGIISCTKEIEFKGDLGKSSIVVNGLLENDSLIRISLSKSKPAIGEQNTGPSEITSSATLVLTDKTTGETFTSNQVNSNGEYEFATTAKSGHTYSVSITHPDFPVATSQTSIPAAVPINDWDTSSTVIDAYTSEKKMEISWNDPAGEDMYILKVFAVDTILHTEESIYIKSNESTDVLNNSGGLALLLKDDLFDNATKTLPIAFFPVRYYDQTTGTYSDEKSYRAVLFHVTKEVYNYILSTSKYMETGNSPFAEPVKVYTNITNGLGVFGGMASYDILIE